MMCQRTRRILEKGTALGSERPVSGTAQGRGLARAQMRKEKETGCRGPEPTERRLECLACPLSHLSIFLITTSAGFDRKPEAVFMPSTTDRFL